MTFATKLIGVSAIALGLAAPAVAQTASQTPTPPADAPSAQAPATGTEVAKSYTDEELATFVDAALAVTEVQRAYAPQVEAAADETEKQKLVETAQQEMVDAVEGVEGMDLAKYNEIGQAAQADQDLNQRITALVKEKMPGQPQKSDG